MAANTGGGDSTGRKNFYNVSYGMLSSNAKQAPDGYEEIALTEIKSKRQKQENVDLRKKFYDSKNGKEYPLRVFYTDITGNIQSVEKVKFEKSTFLNVTLIDKDGDESVIQSDFYNKITADFLNRLLNVNPENQLNFRPYSIPSTYDAPDGSTINFYSAGVSIKDSGTKIQRAFNKDNGLPDTEQVQNSKGENETSRVKQINFLWEKVESKFANLVPTAPEQVAEEAPKNDNKPKEEAAAATTVPHDDLPF